MEPNLSEQLTAQAQNHIDDGPINYTTFTTSDGTTVVCMTLEDLGRLEARIDTINAMVRYIDSLIDNRLSNPEGPLPPL